MRKIQLALIVGYQQNYNNITAQPTCSILQRMTTSIKQDLQRMAQAITINAHYTCNLGNLNILFQYQFYFDICQIIFPELSIQLVKIKESEKYDPPTKMDKLIDLLHHELQINNLSHIKGSEIIKGENISHLHRFLQILEKFSEYHQANSKEESGSRRVKSDPNTSDRREDGKRVPRSARQKIKYNNMQDSETDHQIPKQNQSHKKRNPKKQPSYSAPKKQRRSKAQTCKNLYSSLVNIMMSEKNRTIKASLRDNRKDKNQQIIQAKNKYKSYLINYAKQSRATKNREAKLKVEEAENQRELPLDDFQNIQDFFKSFQLKLRDQKYCYLKRIQKMVRSQQIDRMCYLKKIEQEQNKQVKKSTKKQLQRIENEHKIRNNLLREQFDSEKQSNLVVKKEYERYLRMQKKELKQTKKKQMQKIRDFMEQENGKVLVSLEEGGRLQKTILDMYKRF